VKLLIKVISKSLTLLSYLLEHWYTAILAGVKTRGYDYEYVYAFIVGLVPDFLTPKINTVLPNTSIHVGFVKSVVVTREFYTPIL